MVATETKASKRRDFKNVSIRFSIRMNYVLPPFDAIELIDTLVKGGYTPTIPPQPRPPRGVRLGFAGPIARKGETTIDTNDERGILGATSPSPALAVQSLNELLQLIKSNLGIDLDKTVTFYEMIGHMDIDTDQNPLEKIGQIHKENTSLKEFSEILGKDVSVFSLRLIPRNEIPNQTEWLDITIEPDIIKTTSTYNVSAVYRSPDKSKVQKFTEEFMTKVSTMIDVIESV